MEKQTAAASSNNLVKVVIGLWVGVFLGVAIIAVLVYTGVIPLFGAGSANPAAVPEEAPLARLESGIMAPTASMADLEGNPVTLADYRGKVLVVNFWATWCGPCVREMPMFQEYQDRYPQMVVLGVDQEESPETVKEFLTQLQLTYTILLDQKADMGRALQITFLPTTIFVDEKGEIRFRHYGIMNAEQMDYYLKTLGVVAE
jgi:thiol-disulfide isomerase/thioredoxin